MNEPLYIKYGYNPLDEYDNPTDALGHISCVIKFLNEAIGSNHEDFQLTPYGKEGFQFILNFIEGSIRQVCGAITKETEIKAVNVQEAAKEIGKYIIKNNPKHKDLEEALNHLTDAITGKKEDNVIKKKKEDAPKIKKDKGKNSIPKVKKEDNVIKSKKENAPK